MNFLIRFYKNFNELTRAYALGVTLASCAVVWAFSKDCITFSYLNFLLLIVALLFVHMGANLFDDFLDVVLKLKKVGNIDEIKFNCFELKAKLILDKTFSLNEVEFILLILFSLPALIGLYFILTKGLIVFLFAIIGLILVLLYPISSKYYLSEVVIGLIYGPLIINAGYYSMCGQFSSLVFFVSIPVFFSTLVLLHTHNLMDWENDIKEGKNTLCILSKNKVNAIRTLKWIINCSYLFVVLGVMLGLLNPKSLYVFLTLPIATKLPESLNDYINIKDISFIPRWYYGFFENWKKIKEMKIEYFMYRFYLGRNYTVLFAILLAIGTIS